jgi:hypothetical protein
MPRRYIALAGLLAAAVALVCASGMPGLIDPDGFSHLAYARRLWESGFSLRGHPFLPLTMLGDTGVDPWLGFHYLLLPFLPFGDLWGARLAGAAIACGLAATLAWAISAMTPRRGSGDGPSAPWWLALAPLSLGVFLIRDQTARPGHVSTALMLVQLVAGAGFVTPFAALGAGFAHGLMHLSSPFSPVFCMLGFAGARGGFRRAGAGSSRAVLWSVGGVALALLVRPDRSLLCAEGLAQTLLVFGKSLPHGSAEVGERGVRIVLREGWPLFALCLAAAVAGLRRERCGEQPAVRAALLAVLLSCLMMVVALRFVDYGAPCLALLTAMLWPREPLKVRRWLTAVAALAFAWLLPLNVARSWDVGHHFYDEPAAFERIAASVRKTVPPGSMIFTDDAWMTQILLSYLPEYRYLLAYDPVLLYMGSPQLFWLWHHAVGEGIDCPAPDCGPQQPSGAAIARVLSDFGTSYAVTSTPRGRLSMQEVMARDPSRFELVELSPGQAYGLYLWKLRPSARMH